MDNFLFGVNLNSEELLIKEQNARPHYLNYLFEKTFHLRKLTLSGTFEKRMPSRKDTGYTLTTTPHEKIESSKGLKNTESFKKSMGDMSEVSNDSYMKMLKKALGSNTIMLNVEHGADHEDYIHTIKDPEQRKGQGIIH